MKRHVLIFGLVGGLLIATLQYTEYRFVILEHSVELYSALVAILFAAFGIWLGLRITPGRETIRETVVVKEVFIPAEAPASAQTPFAPNAAHQQTLNLVKSDGAFAVPAPTQHAQVVFAFFKQDNASIFLVLS